MCVCRESPDLVKSSLAEAGGLSEGFGWAASSPAGSPRVLLRGVSRWARGGTGALWVLLRGVRRRVRRRAWGGEDESLWANVTDSSSSSSSRSTRSSRVTFSGPDNDKETVEEKPGGVESGDQLDQLNWCQRRFPKLYVVVSVLQFSFTGLQKQTSCNKLKSTDHIPRSDFIIWKHSLLRSSFLRTPGVVAEAVLLLALRHFEADSLEVECRDSASAVLALPALMVALLYLTSPEEALCITEGSGVGRARREGPRDAGAAAGGDRGGEGGRRVWDRGEERMPAWVQTQTPPQQTPPTWRS